MSDKRHPNHEPRQYTIVYTSHHMHGCHQATYTHFARVITNNLYLTLRAEYDSAIFAFEGHPQLEGEEQVKGSIPVKEFNHEEEEQ